MSRPKIVQLIGPNGEVRVTVEGATGKSCKDLTRGLEAALGVTESDSLKPEFYTEATSAQHDVHQS